MAEIETNDFVISIESDLDYGEVWKRRLVEKIRKANDGDVLIVQSGLQKAIVAALISGNPKRLKVVKR